jgi:hypothetical protein
MDLWTEPILWHRCRFFWRTTLPFNNITYHSSTRPVIWPCHIPDANLWVNMQSNCWYTRRVLDGSIEYKMTKEQSSSNAACLVQAWGFKPEEGKLPKLQARSFGRQYVGKTNFPDQSPTSPEDLAWLNWLITNNIRVESNILSMRWCTYSVS